MYDIYARCLRAECLTHPQVAAARACDELVEAAQLAVFTAGLSVPMPCNHSDEWWQSVCVFGSLSAGLNVNGNAPVDWCLSAPACVCFCTVAMRSPSPLSGPLSSLPSVVVGSQVDMCLSRSLRGEQQQQLPLLTQQPQQQQLPLFVAVVNIV